MNSTNVTAKSPMPETFHGMSVSSLLDRAKRTVIGKLAKRWHDLELELVRLNNRRDQVAGDKVIASVIDDRISDNEAIANQVAQDIADTPAKNAVDVVCKLAITTRMQCGEGDPESRLSSSALADLVRFVSAAQSEAG